MSCIETTKIHNRNVTKRGLLLMVLRELLLAVETVPLVGLVMETLKHTFTTAIITIVGLTCDS